MSFERQVLPATVIPLADGNGNTRTGVVGASLLYARQDHVHPITRIANPVTPTLTAGGGGVTLSGISGFWTSTTEETATYQQNWTAAITGAAGWKSFVISNPAGMAAEWQTCTGYRTAGTPFGPISALMLDTSTIWFYHAGVNQTIVFAAFKQWRLA